VPLDQLFSELEIDLTMPLEPVDPLEVEAVQLRTPVISGFRTATDEIEIEIGFGIKCKGQGTMPQISVQNVTRSLTGDLTGRLRYSSATGFESLAVTGNVSANMTVRPTIDLAWGGKVKCERDIKEFTVPIGAWLALFFGFQVPVGVGFQFDGEVDVGQIGFDIAANASASVQLEFSCPIGSDCSSATALQGNANGSLKLVAPNLADPRIDLAGRGYVYAKLNLGPSKALTDRASFLKGLKFKLLEANAGLTQTLDLASSNRQATDATYASKFDLKFEAEIKADLELKSAFDALGQKLGYVMQIVEEPFWSTSSDLANSPRGTFTISPAAVKPGDDEELGDLATFTVELDPITYLGLESVEMVEFLWWKEDDEGSFSLENGRPACTTIAATQGQTKFECKTDFLEEHVGEQTFYAFVHAKLFGVALPIPLEIAVDGKATVNVKGPVEVILDPGEVTLVPGEVQEFQTTVVGSDDQSVTWSASGGDISQSGLFVAGDTPGTYAVRATSFADPTAWAESTVEIVPPSFEGKFEGAFTDQSDCINPAVGSWPVVIWLYDHSPETNSIRVAANWYSTSGSRNNAEDYWQGTIQPDGSLRAFGIDDPEDYEFIGTVSGSSFVGRAFEHCSNGTADIWDFATTRVD
jgi:hypothetical protein